ncbi:NAD(P)-dependent oxidoreductase [Deinococcus sp. HMF7620]|uniref:NAD(P)-dependent oxidoreductase n=1 Tax=Deinococcus arboris TaxID=2682977 RepID=A0A7C9M8R9_9DEIO|nr:NAD(P)-dependent oxidoreductase [Deinococcus arboris]
MILVDRALQAREAAGTPVRVGMIGAGFMGRGVANQIVNSVPGMRLVAISNRTLAGARRAYAEAGMEEVREVTGQAALEDAIRAGRPVVTEDARLLCRAEGIDCLIDVTGDVEFGAQVTVEAIAHHKHMVTMNAELDATVGPLLKVMAERAGVIFTAADGDQPGVQMNLYRFVRSLGLTPLLCGNIKGLQDPYRTPTTQQAFAERWGQNPYMVTSFADGTKISFEQAIVANGTGLRVSQRGMRGLDFPGHVDDLRALYDVDELRACGGVVDYVVGARPGPGVFVYAAHDDPRQRHYLNLYKLGEGPLYSFYTPYHLCHFEVPLSAARVVLFGDAVLQALGGPVVDVVTTAKRALKAGETIDGLGGYMTYGQCENADVTAAQRLLPMGLAAGARLRWDLPQDHVLTYDDVVLPPDQLAGRLRAEQDALFAPASAVPSR